MWRLGSEIWYPAGDWIASCERHDCIIAGMGITLLLARSWKECPLRLCRCPAEGGPGSRAHLSPGQRMHDFEKLKESIYLDLCVGNKTETRRLSTHRCGASFDSSKGCRN